MSDSNLKALISLLDDPDSTVFNQVRDELIKMGPQAIHPLEEAWEHAHDLVFQKRIEELIHEIQFIKTQNELTNWAKSEQQDLLKGALIIAKYQYPDLNEEKIYELIEQIRKDIWLEINDNLTALEKVKVINHILYDVYNFNGNVADYHAAQNSFINVVLESKKGNPLSLSILYAVLAQKLEIPVYGINLPEHFILGYVDLFQENPTPEELKNSPILFYINAFSKGIVFSRKDIDNFLKQLNLEPRPHYYEPCSNLDIIKRMLRNLALAFEKAEQEEKKAEVILLLEAIEKLS
jgi:regulator of sirC expression with transglutaminase-like and TPR domain